MVDPDFFVIELGIRQRETYLSRYFDGEKSKLVQSVRCVDVAFCGRRRGCVCR